MIDMTIFEKIINAICAYILLYGLPTAFIVFLVLALVQIPKVKRKERKPVKLIVFGAISLQCLLGTIIEILFVLWLAQGIAHM